MMAFKFMGIEQRNELLDIASKLKHPYTEDDLGVAGMNPSKVKELMYEQFMKDGGEDLVSQLGMNKLSNPVTDIVDSYYIMRTGNEDWYCN